MSEIALSVKGLAKRYDSVEAIRGVSFDVEAGEIFGLIGPNGAGKSTTLECILGLCAPDSGSILVKGKDIGEKGSNAKSVIGAQLQTSGLPDAMTPRQALRLCASFYRRSASPECLLDRFRLIDKADAKYASLSEGQRQRLALAMAFVNEPEIVVLDEPTAGLDPLARRELHELIALRRSEGCTVIFSTHYLDEARTLCDRIAMLNRGSLIAMASPEQLISRSASRPQIELRAIPGVAEDQIKSLPGALSCTVEGALWRVRSSSVNLTLTALAVLAESKGEELIELQIRGPTLDDVFHELVGAETE